jgi:hypothetical protein
MYKLFGGFSTRHLCLLFYTGKNFFCGSKTIATITINLYLDGVEGTFVNKRRLGSGAKEE